MDHIKGSIENPMMNFLVARYGLRNLVLENQKRKVIIEADALASPTGKADPPFLQLPKVMSTVIASQNHQLATGGLKTIQEEGEETETSVHERIQRSINCLTCGQNINWCECPTL
jgi:hypothetical protein